MPTKVWKKWDCWRRCCLQFELWLLKNQRAILCTHSVYFESIFRNSFPTRRPDANVRTICETESELCLKHSCLFVHSGVSLARSFFSFSFWLPVQANLPIESVLNYEVAFPSPTPLPTESLPTPTPSAGEEKQYAVVTTTNARANLRDSATTSGNIVGKGNPGDAFEVIGQTSDGQWYEVCCVAGTDKSGWVAASVVRITSEPGVVVNTSVSSSTVQTATETLLNSDLTAKWNVDWQCGSERCTVKQCSATVEAAVKRPNNSQWLPIEHNVTWDKTCFSTAQRYTGRACPLFRAARG